MDVQEAGSMQQARVGSPYDAIISEWGIDGLTGESMVRSLEGIGATLWIYSRRGPRGTPPGVTGVIRWGRQLELLEKLNEALGPLNPTGCQKEIGSGD